MYLGQIGYCVLLVLARKPETKVGNFARCETPGADLTTENLDQRSRAVARVRKLGHGSLGSRMGMLSVLEFYSVFILYF
jgi:hypothetical protein